MAGATIATLPTLLVFIVFQRYIIPRRGAGGPQGLIMDQNAPARAPPLWLGRPLSRARIRDAVLGPVFAHQQAFHFHDLMRLHRAHGIMLAEQGLLTTDEIGSLLAALDAVEADLAARPPAAYTGEHEDLFFHVEGELKRQCRRGDGGALHTGRSRNEHRPCALQDAVQARGRCAVGSRGHAHRDDDRAGGEGRRHDHLRLYAWAAGAALDLRHYLGALIETLLRDAERLEQARRVLDLSPWRGRDHHHRLSTGSPADGGALGFSDILLNS